MHESTCSEESFDGLTAGFAGCPHVDRNDARCAQRFSLAAIEQTFCICFGSFHGCATFHRINSEMQRAAPADCPAPAPLPFIDISIHANRHVTLRPTGT